MPESDTATTLTRAEQAAERLYSDADVCPHVNDEASAIDRVMAAVPYKAKCRTCLAEAFEEYEKQAREDRALLAKAVEHEGRCAAGHAIPACECFHCKQRQEACDRGNVGRFESGGKAHDGCSG